MNSKGNLWDEYVEQLDGEQIELTDLFNYFNTDELQEFLEFLRDEME